MKMRQGIRLFLIKRVENDSAALVAAGGFGSYSGVVKEVIVEKDEFYVYRVTQLQN